MTTIMLARRCLRSTLIAKVSNSAKGFVLLFSVGSSGRRLSSTTRKGIADHHDDEIVRILQQVQDGTLTPSQAQQRIHIRSHETTTPRAENDDDDDPLRAFANLDYRRARRVGFPEAVFAQGKTATQVALILDRMAANATATTRQQSCEDQKMNEDDGIKIITTPILATRYDFFWTTRSRQLSDQTFSHKVYMLLTGIPASLYHTTTLTE
jgi:hypothetical protein